MVDLGTIIGCYYVLVRFVERNGSKLNEIQKRLEAG